MKNKMLKIWTRNYNLCFMGSIVWALNFEAKKFLGYQFKSALGSGDLGKHTWWMNERDGKKFKEIITKRFIKDLKSFKKYLANYERFRDKFRLVSKEINSKNLKRATSKQLAQMYRKFYEADFEFMLWGQYIAFTLIEMIPQVLKERLIKEKIKSAEIEKIIFGVLSPSKIKAVTKMEDEILELAAQNPSKEEQIMVIKSLAKKYGWIPAMTPDVPLWDEEFFKNRINEAKNNPNLQKLIEESANAKKEAKELQKKFSELLVQYPKLKELFIIANGLTDLKDSRDEARRHVYFLSRPLFEETVDRAKLKMEDVVALTHFEIYKFLSKGTLPTLEEIKARQKNFVIFVRGNDFKILSGKTAAEYIKNNLEQEAENSEAEIHGIVASQGVVKAKVRIVLDKKDLPFVGHGEVLVAVTTHPDYLSAMKRACAIVTDEGGLTSHAAIVSREFKIPCIVGTKIATKILKTGDTVEVDANKGIIKIINPVK